MLVGRSNSRCEMGLMGRFEGEMGGGMRLAAEFSLERPSTLQAADDQINVETAFPNAGGHSG